MKREEFIAHIRHIGWISYQIAADQPYNEKINNDQFDSLLDRIKFQDEHPDNTPEQNHNNWMKMKMGQGWIYGEIKDFNKKTHPDLIPYKKLPEIEQKKDISDTLVHRLANELWIKLQNE